MLHLVYCNAQEKKNVLLYFQQNQSMLSTSMKINNEYRHIIITHLGMILMQVQERFLFLHENR